MAKSILRIKAINLRKEGLGIKAIANQLTVSSSTASLWCRNIKLTEEQIELLKQHHHDPLYGKRLDYIRQKQTYTFEKIQRLYNEGINEIGELSNKELFVTGIGLYWAEGFKKDNLVGFSNSDPDMIKFFLRWLDDCCGIPKERLKVRLGLNEYYKDKVINITNYWSKYLKIPLSQFQKPYFQKVQWKKVYENPENYKGVLRVRVTKSTDLLRKIKGWIQGLRLNILQ